MFTDPEVATDVLKMMRNINGELNESLVNLKGRVPDEEWQIYRRRVGAIMAEILGEVTYHIGERHPDLRPLIYGK